MNTSCFFVVVLPQMQLENMLTSDSNSWFWCSDQLQTSRLPVKPSQDRCQVNKYKNHLREQMKSAFLSLTAVQWELTQQFHSYELNERLCVTEYLYCICTSLQDLNTVQHDDTESALWYRVTPPSSVSCSFKYKKQIQWFISSDILYEFTVWPKLQH